MLDFFQGVLAAKFYFLLYFMHIFFLLALFLSDIAPVDRLHQVNQQRHEV